MPVRTFPLSAVIAVTGTAGLLAMVLLAASRASLGSPLFFALIGTFAIAYGAMFARVAHADPHNRRAFGLALLFALLFRLPLALAPVDGRNDMVRYLWDGRVQQSGYNPYAVVPSDPALAATHTRESVVMPSVHARTPYPPAAQLFFRMVVGIHDSTRAMKLALVGCDLLTIAVIWRWLLAAGRSKWLTLAYAWNPLVVIEIAHSGHVDALAALWLVAAAYWLTRRRTLLAAIAYTLAVTTKLLPIVLLPLFIGRIRLRDAAAAAALLVLLYLPFHDSASPALGAVPNVVDHIRFNGPVFLLIASVTSARIAAAAALLAGLGAALIARRRLEVSDPAAWAWPVAIALACAPVVYPWYLLSFTPFLWSRRTAPLVAWCFTSLGAYVVWERVRHGGLWVVPAGVLVLEFAVPMAVAVVLALRRPHHPKLDSEVPQASVS